MAGVRLGWFSPSVEIGDAARVADRIKEICGPTSAGFPFMCSPVKDPAGVAAISYAVVRGHVPIHIDRPNAAERCPGMFMLVLTAENRPVLLAREATQEATECVLLGEGQKAACTAFGAFELWPGRVVYFDITKHFHGITGYPTGDFIAEFPECVLIQVPWPRADDFAGALLQMKRIMRLDERFSDMIPQEHGHGDGDGQDD